MAGPKKSGPKKEKKNIPTGVAHIQASFNNTIVSITDQNGHVICWSSAGNQGFKGSRKSTPFAAQMASENAGKKAMENGNITKIHHVDYKVMNVLGGIYVKYTTVVYGE